jgi:iron complex outermembrane receptor protein
LKPETIRSYELVGEQVITPHLQLVSSLFDYDIKDLISFGEDANGSAIFGNLSSATSRGAEVELDANWAEGWTARTSYTFTDARDGTGRRLTAC